MQYEYMTIVSIIKESLERELQNKFQVIYHFAVKALLLYVEVCFLSAASKMLVSVNCDLHFKTWDEITALTI